MANENARMIAWGRRKLRLSRNQRGVDVASAQAKSAAIEAQRVIAVAQITLNTGPGDTAAQAALTTMATRITELNAILAGFASHDTTHPHNDPSVGPILTNLADAKTAAALHTTQGRSDATTAFNAAKTKINNLTSEVKTDAVAAIDAGIANIALATTPGDNAAIVNADAAIAAVNLF